MNSKLDYICFMKAYTSLFFVVYLMPLCLYGQDNQYDALQLGVKNSLLTGAGVSSWQDQTAVYINPATLTQTKINSVSLNTAAFGFSTLYFKNGYGEGYSLSSNQTRFLPSLIAGNVKLRSMSERWMLGYAIYHRNRDRLRASARLEDDLNVINDVESPGNENYISQYILETDFDETAGVAGIGYELNDRWSFGASLNGIYRQHSYLEDFSANAVTYPENNPQVDVVSSRSNFNAEYFNFMFLLKLGAALRIGQWRLGLTLSTSSVQVLGKGDILAEASLSNMRIPGISDRKNFLASTRLVDLKSTFKYPLSLALGGSRHIGKFDLAASVSYYFSQEVYTVLDPGNAVFIRPSTDENVLVTDQFLRVFSVNREVVNATLSADWRISDRFEVLFSYALDQNYSDRLPSEPGINMAVKTWDLHHFNTGIHLIRPKAEWIVGVQSAIGGATEFRQSSSFNNPTEDNFLQGEPVTGSIDALSLALVLSFSLQLGTP